MTFQASQIGTDYDIGIATRPDPTGAVVTLNCLNEDGVQVPLSQVAFMFLANDEQEEAVDLIRKDQLIRLSSANVIDREFTMYPQATQGNWRGGELQRVFTDPTAYWQGRGLLFPQRRIAPSTPFVESFSLPTGATAAPAAIAVGQVGGGVAGTYWAYGYTTAGGTFVEIRSSFIPAFVVTSPALAAALTTVLIFNRKVWFTENGSGTLFNWDSSGGAPNAFAAVAGLSGSGSSLMVGAVIGATAYIAIVSASTIVIYDANNAATFTTLTIPANWTVKSIAFLGSALYYTLADTTGATTAQSTIQSYDLTAQQTASIAALPGYGNLQIGAVQGALFVVASSVFATDCYLLVGSSLQSIGTIPPVIQGINPISYNPVESNGPTGGDVSNVVAMGTYAVFVAFGAMFAYDVVNGAFFTVADSSQASVLGVIQHGPNSLAVYTGPGYRQLNLGSPNFINAQFAVFFKAKDANFYFFIFGPLQTAAYWPQAGRIISSIIDFTSASAKLYRQIVVDHLPVLAGCNVTLAAWLDQDIESLNPAPDFVVTHSYNAADPNPKQTVLSINKIAVKVVYLLDYSIGANLPNTAAPAPIAVKIQAATGWIFNLQLALSDSAMTNGQNPQETCFQQQDNQLDALAARNFLRQLWRQRGGQCVATYSDGDSYNAVIQDYHVTAKKFKTINQLGDRRLRYEGKLQLKIAEDL